MIIKSYGLLAVAVISLAAAVAWLADPSPARTSPTAGRTNRELARTHNEPGKCFRAAVISQDVQLQHQGLEQFLPAWVNSDVSAAAKFVENLPQGELREKALRVIAQHWGEHDPQAAIAWAGLLADASERAPAIANVLLGFAIEHPADAVEMADAQPEREPGLLENLTQQWAETDPSAASCWVIARDPGDERDRLLQRVTLIQSKTRPFEAANLALERIPPGDVQIETLISILHQWAQTDLPAATAWALKFPEGDLRDRAIAETAGFTR